MEYDMHLFLKLDKINWIQIYEQPNLLKKRHLTGEQMKRIRYSKVKNNTAA